MHGYNPIEVLSSMLVSKIYLTNFFNYVTYIALSFPEFFGFCFVFFPCSPRAEEDLASGVLQGFRLKFLTQLIRLSHRSSLRFHLKKQLREGRLVGSYPRRA